MTRHARIIVGLCLLFFMALLIMFPAQALSACRESFSLFIYSVFPALFPFFVCTSLLMRIGAIHAISKRIEPFMRFLFGCSGKAGFVFCMSILAGYPMGARLIGQLRSRNEISIQEAQHMLSFCSTSGPLFILGAVSIGMLGNAQIGYTLLCVHILSAIFTGLLLKPARPFPLVCEMDTRKKITSMPFGTMLLNAITEGLKGMSLVGSLILLFSIILSLLKAGGFMQYIVFSIEKLLVVLQMPSIYAEGIFAGVWEISNGAHILSSAVPQLTPEKIALISAVMAWGGFSVHAQSIALLSGSGVKPSAYLCSKLIQTMIAYILALFASYAFLTEFQVLLVLISYILVFIFIFIAGTLLKRKLHCIKKTPLQHRKSVH